MKKKNIQVVEKLSATDFPPCVRTFWTNAKSPGDPMIGLKFVIIALVCYAVLMPRLRVKYLYNLMMSIILLNLLVIGPSGKGKSIVNYIVSYILKVLYERDKKERAWSTTSSARTSARRPTRSATRNPCGHTACCRSSHCPCP